jgi:hypothetical protein
MTAPSKKKMKPMAKIPMAKMAATDKGSIHHIEIHPAKNSTGGMGFRTMVHRNRPAAAQKMTDAGHYVSPPEPEETVHEDPQDMLDHLAKSYGVPNDPDSGDEGDENEQEAA